MQEKLFLPPGTVNYVGEDREHDVDVTHIQYDRENYSKSVEMPESQYDNGKVDWLDVDGIHDTDIINKLGNQFNLHKLVLEDIANTNQRPKTEFYDGYLFTCVKMISFNEEKVELGIEQVSFVLSNDYLITFQEKTGDVFNTVRRRIEENKGIIRTRGNDYLFYSLMDSIVDHYYAAIEGIGNYIGMLEEEIIEKADSESLNKIQKNKKLLIELRSQIFPLREALNLILKERSDQIEKKNLSFLMDVYDHCVQIIETVEIYRELNNALRDTYHSNVSLKMNQIMQVLTIISTVFIPLTFISGIYGMNFEHIPELGWEYGYLYFWIAVLVIGVGLLIYFKRKKWL